MWWPDHKVILFLVFWGTSILFFTVAVTNLHSHQQPTHKSFETSWPSSPATWANFLISELALMGYSCFIYSCSSLWRIISLGTCVLFIVALREWNLNIIFVRWFSSVPGMSHSCLLLTFSCVLSSMCGCHLWRCFKAIRRRMVILTGAQIARFGTTVLELQSCIVLEIHLYLTHAMCICAWLANFHLEMDI